MYEEASMMEFPPGYVYCGNPMIPHKLNNTKSACGVCKTILTLIIAVGLSFGGFYYYENFHLLQNAASLMYEKEMAGENQAEKSKSSPAENLLSLAESINEKIDNLTKELATVYQWRATVNAELTKMQWEQGTLINNAIVNALEIYEADGIGKLDYAASYAGGVITGISEETRPYPAYPPLSLFKIAKLDVFSSPEQILRPSLLPGNCFAFRGAHGAIRIELGRPIAIGSVTLSHAPMVLLEDKTSTPKDFEVFGFTDPEDETGTFLGKFTYELTGKQHQTFRIKKTMSQNRVFRVVELAILNNYGKREFTCLYRFRVHRADSEGAFAEFTRSPSKMKAKKCC